MSPRVLSARQPPAAARATVVLDWSSPLAPPRHQRGHRPRRRCAPSARTRERSGRRSGTNRPTGPWSWPIQWCGDALRGWPLRQPSGRSPDRHRRRWPPRRRRTGSRPGPSPGWPGGWTRPCRASANLGMFGSVALTWSTAAVRAGRRGSAWYSADLEVEGRHERGDEFLGERLVLALAGEVEAVDADERRRRRCRPRTAGSAQMSYLTPDFLMSAMAHGPEIEERRLAAGEQRDGVLVVDGALEGADALLAHVVRASARRRSTPPSRRSRSWDPGRRSRSGRRTSRRRTRTADRCGRRRPSGRPGGP